MRRLAIFFTLTAVASFAQLNRGTLTGAVTDASGAAVPAAKVAIRHAATNSTYNTATTHTGQYTMPNLPTGAYHVTVEAAGFKTYSGSGIELSAADVVRLDVRLEVGAISDSVSVTAEVTPLQNESPEVNTNLTTSELLDLPLSFSGARSPEDFAFKLTPGVSGSPGSTSVNGSTTASKETLLDGASVSTLRAGHFAESSVSVEALAEFKVQTSGMSAEYGRMQAGVFNFVMKSGSNQLHGSAYAALRNEALHANTFANNFRGTPRAKDRRQNAALSVGGPVTIPWLYRGRNRTFFYAAYERFKQREEGFGSPSRSAPLAEFYDGNFSRLLGPLTGQKDALGRDVSRGAVYDPDTYRQVAGGRWVGDMFPGNRIPVSRISAASRRLNEIAKAHYLPTVTDASGQTPTVRNALFPVSTTPTFDQHQFSIKGDQVVTSAHRISMSYSYTSRPRLLLDQGGLWDITDPLGGPLSKARQQDITSYLGRVAWDWVATPRLLNHADIAYNRMTEYARSSHVQVNGAAEIGIKGLTTDGFPAINWGGGPLVTLDTIGYTQNTFNGWVGFGLRDTLSWSAGRHFLRVGLDFRGNHLNYNNERGGALTFSPLATAIPGELFSGNLTGYSFASYLLGIVHSASLNDPAGLGDRRRYYSLFVQDDIKVSPRFTLQAGLRWEFSPLFHEAADRLSSWSLEQTDPVSGLPGAYQFAGSCQACTGRSSFGRRDVWNFGPRLGFAWRVDNHWTLRGAYGIFYEGDIPGGKLLNKNLSTAWGGTWVLAQDAVQPWAGLFQWDNGFPTNRLVPADYDRSWGNSNAPRMIDPNYGQAPYIQQWNLGAQRDLGRNLFVEARYVGNKGTALRAGELANLNQLPVEAMTAYGRSLNNAVRTQAEAAASGIRYPFAGFRGTVASAIRPYPQVTGTSTVGNYGAPLGFSTYHSLQVTVNRRLARGLSGNANYSWAKSLSNVSSSRVGQNDAPLDYYNLRLEKSLGDFDRPHSVKALVSYELPVGRGKALAGGAGRLVNALIGGWSASAILNYFSGAPLGYTGSSPLASVWNGGTNRANVAPGELKAADFDKSRFELSTLSSPSNRYLDKTKFSDPPQLTLGNGAPVYAQTRTFGTINEDLALRKVARLGESWRLQFRAEALNAFNRSTLGGITTSVTNSQFGQVTSISGNRQMQLGLRLDF
jgi:hypothetical protein